MPTKPKSKPAQRPTFGFPAVNTRLTTTPGQLGNDQVYPFKDPTGNATMNLQDFFGASAISAIVNSGQIIFHSVGDTGVGMGNQEAVAQAMASDVNHQNPEQGPSFLVHLGDVMYGPNKEAQYADKFYRVYDSYTRLTFAIPGNHDGEELPKTDPVTLAAFLTNFCAAPGTQPPMAKQFNMLMPTQPGPYWCLQAPFIDIIGLYSNAAEDLGVIDSPQVGGNQKPWLQARLTAIAKARTPASRKALLIVVHHPPYARGFQATGKGHPSNPQMLATIDACCAAAGILPDAVLAGHTHNYQRYMRTQSLGGSTWTIPYLIVGTGGIAVQPVPAPTNIKNPTADVLYASAYEDYGYVTVTVSATQLTLAFTAVVANHRELRETTTINLATHQQV
jgi:Calcineurin-like phosphoesterase